MPRSMRIALTVLAVAVVVGLLSFRSLHRRIQRIAAEQSADEQARHDLLAAPISTPTDVNVKAIAGLLQKRLRHKGRFDAPRLGNPFHQSSQ